jgi:excinuclease ABC subunit B
MVAEARVEYQVGGASVSDSPPEELARLISELEVQMHEAAAALEFEKAALIRDQIYDLRQRLQDVESDVPEWKRDFEVGAPRAGRPATALR